MRTMVSRSLELALLVTLAVAAAIPARAAGTDGPASNRDEAAASIRSDSADDRRRAVLVLGQSGRAVDVPLLMSALNDPDESVRALAEQAIWAIWSRSGDEDVDRLFARGIEALVARRLEESIAIFSRIVHRRPEFAEGWNKRATAYFLAGNLEASAADCREVLARNPQHFGALSGYGLIEERRGNLEAALGYFRRAIALNPNLRGVRANIESIEDELERRRGRST
ncbi:MAG: tetratricopeptide repeat protein [Betaproteobacteria bacterium]|nr:tetratricopeptide repeat protein [Betaproteobacteria bacterium]